MSSDTITISRRWFWFLVAMTGLGGFNSWMHMFEKWGWLP